MNRGFWAVAPIVYLVAGFLTFGHVYNRNYPGVCVPDTDGYWVCKSESMDASFGGVLAGFGWPVYWGGVLALEVTKP
jgi:hypothetical protein